MNASLFTKTVLGTAAAGVTLLVVSASPLVAQRPVAPARPMTPEQMQQQHQEMRVQIEEMRAQMQERQEMQEHCHGMMGGGMMGGGEDAHNHQNHQNHTPQ
ncbi:hypothetical protein J0895_10190 [Phormidium pseudopriestleyi FRX01]|uniref:Uncharacterized protein n=1 Tax=Phormidium pseudopriestleyi FRX01 TaxID=1759528 RepID=A0ABS3FQT4_9CYAN|nr:hypothetical protein [Phormidium pseudopriestleyi]MBO0349470.1 hypothetical protein [Phormidium pseudopriestleyi FRX01]